MLQMLKIGSSDVINGGIAEIFKVGDLNFWQVLLVLLLSFLMGLVIYFTYLKSFRGVVYSQPFNASLVLLCMITALLIVTISSNVVLALGMVGALSIVRFRTAIKDPLDIVFLFWSLSTGMIVGARLYAVAVVATIIIALVFFLMLKVFRGRKPVYLFVLRFDSDIQSEIGRVLAKLDGTVRAVWITAGCLALAALLLAVLIIRIKRRRHRRIRELEELAGMYEDEDEEDENITKRTDDL